MFSFGTSPRLFLNHLGRPVGWCCFLHFGIFGNGPSRPQSNHWYSWMLLCAGGTSSPPEETGVSTKDLVRLIFAEEVYLGNPVSFSFILWRYYLQQCNNGPLAKSKVQKTIASLLDAVDMYQKLAIECISSLKVSLIVNVVKYILLDVRWKLLSGLWAM